MTLTMPLSKNTNQIPNAILVLETALSAAREKASQPQKDVKNLKRLHDVVTEKVAEAIVLHQQSGEVKMHLSASIDLGMGRSLGNPDIYIASVQFAKMQVAVAGLGWYIEPEIQPGKIDLAGDEYFAFLEITLTAKI